MAPDTYWTLVIVAVTAVGLVGTTGVAIGFHYGRKIGRLER